ncbi:MAG: NUDIX domain-containing protein, partial [Woeseiaceae bacterium]
MARTKSATVPARPSATVIMLRDSGQRPELLMVKRRGGDAFGEHYAFPGGVLDEDESLATALCHGMTAEEANTTLGVPEGGLEFYVATVRELFEETGILLARDRRGAWALHGDPATREQIAQGTLAWSEFLREHELRMACDALHYFAHWETPLGLPKRWSARFFLAATPADQDALHDGSELTDSCWLSAAEALETGRQGGMKLPFPTYRTLKMLSNFASVDDLLDWARQTSAQGVPKLRPVELKENGKRKFVIPGDPGYPEGGD